MAINHFGHFPQSILKRFDQAVLVLIESYMNKNGDAQVQALAVEVGTVAADVTLFL